MAELPSASSSLSEQTAAAPISTDLIMVAAPVPSNDDGVPRLFSNTAALLAFHGYSEGVEYAALHMQDTKKPVLFVGLPIATTGHVKRSEGLHTGTSEITLSAGADGILAEVEGVVNVVSGGTVGTDIIRLEISLDGGTTFQQVRLGTAVTYTIPRVGVVLGFSVGTLVTGETPLVFSTVAPTFDATGVTAALAGMQAKQFQVRSWMFVSDQTTQAGVQGILDAANAYASSTKRYVYARTQLRDRRILESSHDRVRMSTSSVTFAEVGGTGDTITAANGKFATNGFVVNDYVVVTGSVSNNVSGKITAVTDTVLTLDTTDLAAEVAATGVSIVGYESFIFASSGKTITRNRGSWVREGFAIGDHITIAGTVSNNGPFTVTAVSASVLTVSESVTNETIGGLAVEFSMTESDTAWVAALDAMVGAIDAEPRIDCAGGRLTKKSPITGYTMRRPVAWAASIREYQHDVKTATWQKDIGPLSGWGIDGEHDERVDGGLLAARITCARTWENGPLGAFIAESLTRDSDDNILSMTHNMAVSNVAQAAVQRTTENFVGRTPVLQPPDSLGRRFATPKSLAKLKAECDKALANNVLANFGEGQRASEAFWTPATDDDLGVPNATLHGVTTLRVNGTLVHINTEQQVS